MPHTCEYERLKKYLVRLDEIGVDALIISDLGVFTLAREIIPSMEIHISTQASTVSAYTATTWHKMGAKRVVLARELSMDEINEIRRNTPSTLELECFIHGSMCISYSGRCLLSNYYTGRDANRGACAQPCRWNYINASPIEFAEEKRVDHRLGLEEYKEGTFVMSSKDMCMIEHIPELMESGIDSFKIEGRMKSAYYTAICANTYKMAMTEYQKDPTQYRYNPLWLRELESVSHREYATGFYYDNPMENPQIVTQGGYLREKAYLCVATGEKIGEHYVFVQRNKLVEGESVELITPGKCGVPFVATDLRNEKGEKIESAPHPSMKFLMKVPFEVKEGDILRSAN
jgi:putative protease